MNIKRGEVWKVDLNDAQGSEINKERPCAVVGSDAISECYVAVLGNDAMGVLPLRIVVPLTRWQERYAVAPWHIPIETTPENGLHIKSSADTFQVRSISENRFTKKIGELTPDDLERIKGGLALCLCMDEEG